MIIANPGFNSTGILQALPPDWPGGFWLHWFIFTTVVINAVLLLVMAFIWIERRGMGRMQYRLGPNRTGPLGLFQPVADAIKVLLKEDIVPTNADKIVHWLAPVVAFAPTLMIFAVIPFGNGASLANLDIGILYVIAVSSVSTLGIFMAGWSSSNKYSLLGAMRNVAAIVSYEMPLVLSVASVVVIAGSLSLAKIVEAQDIPMILYQPLGFLIFFMAGCAEINRSPFDLLEADAEIVAGFHTEYSGMKFAMFYLVEYAEALAISAIITTVFLAGWRGPVLPEALWFVTKVVAVFFLMVWTRTTLPRVRIDQLMTFGWKFLLPLAMINLFITAIQVLVLPESSMWLMIPVNFTIATVLILVASQFFKLGRGRVEV
ncbi:MAG: NADH-quinone oxidoreductase subunit NuoH [Dehalococcoidales bacterium]|nr:NADH-quinone oxidoreductase subunit NuoH [Dehalococcoidales bacterium]